MSKATPRRVLRNARGASKELQGKGDIESGAAFDRLRGTTFTARIVAWGIVVMTIFTLVVGGKCILSYGTNADDPVSVAVPVESPAPSATVEPYSGPGPFPDAPTIGPIITDVECPAGAVKIATGRGRPTDTVCVRGRVIDAPYTDTSTDTSSMTVIDTPGLTWGMVCTGTGQCIGPIFRPCTEDELAAVDGECLHVGDADTGEGAIGQ